MKNHLLHIVTGTVMSITMTTSIAQADVNPFEMQVMQSGHALAMSSSPDEGKCGADKSKAEAKCGGDKAAMDKSATEGKCGGKAADKMPEAKCGGNK